MPRIVYNNSSLASGTLMADDLILTGAFTANFCTSLLQSCRGDSQSWWFTVQS
jgi:hypothetical protein